MKRQVIFTAIFWANVILSLQSLYAFENQRTHPAITERAAVASTIDDYLKTQIGLSDGINTQLSYDFPSEIQTRIDRAHWDAGRTQRPVLEWLKVGSAIEDTDNTWYYKPIRSRHHFLDPTRNAGLDNKTDHPEWRSYAPAWGTGFVFDFTGESAPVWAVNGTASQYPTTNNQSWHNTRTDFYNSLTKPLKNDREKYLAMTFLDLGCFLHLVEDIGVPAHARNDFLFAHYRKRKDHGNPLEKWVEERVKNNNGNIPSDFLTGWTPTARVFDKVSNYFDTDTRNPTDYLGAGVSPPATWGLAEATNYQFFSWSTISPDTNSLYYFPHPNINRCDVTEESGRTYLYGYAVNHLAKFTMSEDFLRHGHLEQAWCTLGEAIYNDYAKITIPRTIDYATGLANYFFRGRLIVEPNQIDPNIVKLVITNDSNNSSVQQKLKGGTFKLYWDNKEGARSQVTGFTVPGWNSSSTLNYGQSTTGQFTRPTPSQGHQISKYIVIYQGQISQNPADPDPYDPNVVAAGIFDPPPRITKITPEMGCPGSVLLIEGSGFSTTLAENTVSFKDVNGVKPDVYGTILDAADNGTWLTVELPYFDASDVDYYWAHTKVTVKGHFSNIYDFKLTNYIWCTIKLWDAGTSIDDEFDLYINNEYFATSYLAPLEDPTIVECGFWYEEGYDFVDTYLYDSHTIPGGTLGMSIEPYVTRVVAYRWNSASEQQEFLYDNSYSGIFSDYFGSDLLVVPNDGIQLDVYLSLTYTGTGQVQLKTRTNRIEKSTTDNSISTREARGKSASADTISKVRKPAMVHKKIGKRMSGDRKTMTRNMLRKAIYNNKYTAPR